MNIVIALDSTELKVAIDLASLLENALEELGHKCVLFDTTSSKPLSEYLQSSSAKLCLHISLAEGNGIISGTSSYWNHPKGLEMHSAMLNVLGLRDRGTSKIEDIYPCNYIHLVPCFKDNMVDVLVLEDCLTDLANALKDMLP